MSAESLLQVLVAEQEGEAPLSHRRRLLELVGISFLGLFLEMVQIRFTHFAESKFGSGSR